MTQNPLAATAVLATMADAIPMHEPNDTTSDVSASYEIVALFIHACMKNLGFTLLGFDEDKHDGTAISNTTLYQLLLTFCDL
jgi:hypothetical protein